MRKMRIEKGSEASKDENDKKGTMEKRVERMRKMRREIMIGIKRREENGRRMRFIRRMRSEKRRVGAARDG